MSQKQFLDLTGLSTFKDLMTQYIGTEDAKSIRSMSISGDTVNFYRSTDATGTVAYTITLPDTSGLIPKIANATGSKVAKTTSTGTVIESEYPIDDLSQLGYISDLRTRMGSIENYVGEIPSGATADNVVDYIDEVAGDCMPKGDQWNGDVIAMTNSDGTVSETAIQFHRVITGYFEGSDIGQITVVSGTNNDIIASGYTVSDITDLISTEHGYITDLESYVGHIPSGATATNVVDYINEIAGAKMPKIANASGYRIVSSNSNGTVSETDIVAENVVTGYFYGGDKIGQIVAVDNIYNGLATTGYTINDLATKAYVGTIPSGASSSNVVAYVGEMTGSISNAQIDALFSAS